MKADAPFGTTIEPCLSPQPRYVFVSNDLERSVRELRVGPIDHRLSDHAPVVLDLGRADEAPQLDS